MLFPEIGKLLDFDLKNVPETKLLFARSSPEFAEGFEEAAQIYRTFLRAFGDGVHNSPEVATLNEAAETFRTSDARRLEKAIRGKLPRDRARADLMRRARTALDATLSRSARATLLSGMFRSYMYGATDLLRLRGTTAVGYLRLQIESAALASLFVVEPPRAAAWWDITDDHLGRQFFASTKPSVHAFIERHELAFAANFSSGVFQHPRLWSVVWGVTFNEREQGGHQLTEIDLSFQDMLNEPEELLRLSIWFLLTQRRLFQALPEGLPEVTDDILVKQRIPRFGDRVARLWTGFQERYPDAGSGPAVPDRYLIAIPKLRISQPRRGRPTR